jgi:hypothetical protein
MADAGLLDRINAAKKRHAKGKHCMSDEFSAACDALVVAEKKFNKLDATVRTNSSRMFANGSTPLRTGT